MLMILRLCFYCLQICMLLDVFTDSKILTQWIVIYLALPIVSSSAFNPWIYGYRNGELRLAVQKVVDDVLTLLGFNYRSHPITDAHVVPPSIAATAGDAGSLINHHPNCNHLYHQHNPLALDLVECVPQKQTPIKREYYSWNPDDEYLLVPMAKPESSGFLSLDDEKCTSVKNINVTFNNNHLNSSGRSLNNNHLHGENNKCAKIGKKRYNRKHLSTHLNFNFVKDIKDFKELKDKKEAKETHEIKECKEDNKQAQNCYNRPGLKGSKSMIESFAGLRNGTDVWIFKGKNLMINGASIV